LTLRKKIGRWMGRMFDFDGGSMLRNKGKNPTPNLMVNIFSRIFIQNF